MAGEGLASLGEACWDPLTGASLPAGGQAGQVSGSTGQSARNMGSRGICRGPYRAVPCAAGHPEEKAVPPGDAGHVEPQGAASAVAPGAGSGQCPARLPAWVSQGGRWGWSAKSPQTLPRAAPSPVGGWGSSSWLLLWPPSPVPGSLGSQPREPRLTPAPPSAAAGCVPLGCPGAPWPSPLCSACTSPSSPPAVGTESAAPTGKCPAHCTPPGARGGGAPGSGPRPRPSGWPRPTPVGPQAVPVSGWCGGRLRSLRLTGSHPHLRGVPCPVCSSRGPPPRLLLSTSGW